jgi:penicillin G amidase
VPVQPDDPVDPGTFVDRPAPQEAEPAMARPVWFRWVVYAGIAVVLALVAGSVAVVRTVRDALPETDGVVQVGGVQSAVTVRRDEAGVPHVSADTAEDLFFGQGYVQAQDRFAQMDLRRMAAEGRLSELFGAETLNRDKLARTLAWERIAERELKLLRPRTVAWLKAFSAGVNAYLRDKDPEELSLEYDVLRLQGAGHDPDRWSPIDSLMWFKVSSWDLAGDVREEVERVAAATGLSIREVDQLHPVRESAAGDAWAVSGDRTETGEPMLAASPHQAPSLPGPWYQVGLHCTDVTDDCPFDVTGFAYPGAPGILHGHNDSIAWAATPSPVDVADLYLEAVQGGKYLRDGRTVDFGVREEVIGVRGEEPFVFEARSTVHGPVVSDVNRTYASVGANAPDGGYDRASGDVLGSLDRVPRGDYAVSLAWTALRPGRSLESVLALDAARSWSEFREALSGFAPQRHFVYADREGQVGLQATGVVPVRRDGTGSYPTAGWQSRRDWEGTVIDPGRLVSVLDPPGGAVVAGATGWPSYSARRVQQLLERGPALSVETMNEIQNDTRHGFAARLVPYLLAVEVGTPYYRNGQRLLRDWDFDQPADSPAAAYFNAVWRNLLRLTFGDQLPPTIRMSAGERWWTVVDRLLDRPQSPWWDDVTTEDVRERRDDIIVRAMWEARDELTRLQARSPSRWTWGHQHSLTLENQTLGQSDTGIVSRLFNRGEWELPGGPDTVAGGGYEAAEGYEVTRTASMRMVVSMADLDDSRWINLTGASGHAFSPHYTDQTDLWVEGRTRPWPYSREAVDSVTDRTLVLEPMSSD